MGQLVEEVTSWEDLGEDVERFLWRSAEGTRDEANALVEHKLGACTEGLVFVGGGPELAAVG